MDNYICPRCNYSTNRKANMVRHINRKFLCDALNLDIKFTKNVKNRILEKKFNFNDYECDDTSSEKTTDSKKYTNTTINNVINNTTINNVTNTIVNITLPYNETNHEFLNDNDYIQCINRMIMSVPNLIQKIHFDPDHPENHNIYISDCSRNKLLMYNGNNWTISNHKEMIDKLLIDHEYLIEEWLENGEDKYIELMKKFKEYMDKKSEIGVEDKIKEEINLILYNNRNVVKNQK